MMLHNRLWPCIYVCVCVVWVCVFVCVCVGVCACACACACVCGACICVCITCCTQFCVHVYECSIPSMYIAVLYCSLEII